MSTIEPILVTTIRAHKQVPGAATGAPHLPAESAVGSAAPPALPLPTVRRRPAAKASSYYAISTMDAKGRIATRSPLRALGWSAGTRLAFRVTDTATVATVDPNGADSITGQGFLHLPAWVRHALHLQPGERLLIITHPRAGVLLASAASALDEILAIDESSSPQR